MANRILERRSPLAELLTIGRHGRVSGSAGVRVREITKFAAIGIAARKSRSADVAKLLAGHFGGVVANEPKRIGAGPLAITGTAPGQWLVTSRGVDPLAALTPLRETLSGIAAVTDQGHGRVILEVAGARARDALAKGIAIDLHSVAFKIGDAAQTSVAYIGIQIALIDDTPTFEIIAPRSTAGSLWSWLSASAAEYGIDIV